MAGQTLETSMPMAQTTKAVEPKGVPAKYQPATEELYFYSEKPRVGNVKATKTLTLDPVTYGQAHRNQETFQGLLRSKYSGAWLVTLKCIKPLGLRANSHKIYEAVVELY